MIRTIKIKGTSKNGSPVKELEIKAKLNLQNLYGDEWHYKTEEIRDELFDFLRKRFSLREIAIK